MSLYYWFSVKEQEYIEYDKPRGCRKYVYDPVTDSYVEYISTFEKEKYLHNKYGRYGFPEFYHVLKELIDEKYPYFERHFLHGGDYSFDEEMELSYGDQKIRYSTYAMYVLSESPEDTIDAFMNMLEKMEAGEKI